MSIPVLTKSIFLMLVLISPTCVAEECGKSLTTSQIEKLRSSIATSQKNILQHMESLTKELTNQALNQRDIGNQVYEEAQGVLVPLEQGLLLTQIKNAMIDSRDRETVERFLSIIAVHTAIASSRAQEKINRLSTSISRPAVALDVSRLRDSVNDVSQALENCTRPRPNR